MTANPNSWTEFVLIGVKSELDTSEIQLAGLTEDVTMPEFEKDIEGLPLVNGGRVVKKTPMKDVEVTFKGYPVSVDNVGTGFGNFFGGTAVTADPITVMGSNDRRRHRVVLTWRDDMPGIMSNPTNKYEAGTVVPGGVAAYRMTMANAYCTKYATSFDDKILSAEVTFKFAPFTKAGTVNYKEESTAGVGATGFTAVTSTPTAI